MTHGTTEPFTAPELATAKRAGLSTIYRAIADGTLAAKKHGRDWLIDAASARAWTPRAVGRPRRRPRRRTAE